MKAIKSAKANLLTESVAYILGKLMPLSSSVSNYGHTPSRFSSNYQTFVNYIDMVRHRMVMEGSDPLAREQFDGLVNEIFSRKSKFTKALTPGLSPTSGAPSNRMVVEVRFSAPPAALSISGATPPSPVPGAEASSSRPQCSTAVPKRPAILAPPYAPAWKRMNQGISWMVGNRSELG